MHWESACGCEYTRFISDRVTPLLTIRFVNALRKRPKSCVVINGEGTELGPERTVTFKTTCQVHEDRETLEWFFGAFAEAMHPGNEGAKAGFIGMMDTPRRVVLELKPVKTISYDGGKLADAIVREGLG